MPYHAHIDGAHSYATRAGAVKKAQKDIPAGVTWIIATNSDGRFVPVAIIRKDTEWMVRWLADHQIYCIN